MRQIVHPQYSLRRTSTKGPFDSTPANFHGLYRTDEQVELETQPNGTEIHFQPASVGEDRDVNRAGLLPMSSQPPKREPKIFRSAFRLDPVYKL